MICPQCKEEGLKSTITATSMYATTAMAYHTYYDEEGRYHQHNPNRSTARLSCSKGHELVHVFQPGCGVEGCEFTGFERLEVARPR